MDYTDDAPSVKRAYIEIAGHLVGSEDTRPLRPDPRSDPAKLGVRRLRELLCHRSGKGCDTCRDPCGYGREYLRRTARESDRKDDK